MDVVTRFGHDDSHQVDLPVLMDCRNFLTAEGLRTRIVEFAAAGAAAGSFIEGVGPVPGAGIGVVGALSTSLACAWKEKNYELPPLTLDIELR